MPTLHVVIPFYNEAPTLRSCLERVVASPLPPSWRRSIVLVDDCSGDGTGEVATEIARDLAAGNCDLTLHTHPENRGKGAALRTGFQEVLESGADDSDLVIIQDADLEYDPADYAALMQPLIDEGADAVYGTRFGGHADGSGLWRTLHSHGNGLLTAYSNLMTGYRLRDMECCYKVLPVKLLRRVLPMLTEDRFGVEPQLTAGLARLECRLAQVPVGYAPRDVAEGKKIGWPDVLRAIYVIGRERFRRAPVDD